MCSWLVICRVERFHFESAAALIAVDLLTRADRCEGVFEFLTVESLTVLPAFTESQHGEVETFVRFILPRHISPGDAVPFLLTASFACIPRLFPALRILRIPCGLLACMAGLVALPACLAPLQCVMVANANSPVCFNVDRVTAFAELGEHRGDK